MIKKRDKKHTIRNLIVFITLIFITFFIIFKDANFEEILVLFRDSNKLFLLIGGLGYLGFISFEAANIKRNLRKLGTKISVIQAYKYSFIGFFFSGITPAATGGQPMQIYYMNRDGINGAKATISLLMSLMSYQIVTISLAIISFCFNAKLIDVGLRVFFVFGIFLNICALTFIVLGIYNSKVAKALINLFIKILKKLKIKKVENIEEKLTKELEQYESYSEYFINNKKMIFKLVLFTLGQYLCSYSITYWVYRAIGLNGCSILKIISLQSVVFATTSGIPSPGAVGVSEAAYMGIFKTVIPPGMLDGALLLSRGINFYIPMLIAGIIVIISSIKSKKKDN